VLTICKNIFFIIFETSKFTKGKSMTVDEYNERLKELLKIQTDARENFDKAKRAVIVFKKEYCYEIAKQYESKIGKKVVIHYEDWQGKEKITDTGFLKEFRWFQGDSFVEDGLYPILTRQKKDGSMSNREFPEYNNTRAEITRIVDIEEVL
jgi:hypothetical protein